MIDAETIFLGSCRSLWILLGLNKAASRMYEKVYKDRLTVSTTRMLELHSLCCTQATLDGDAVVRYVAQPRMFSVDNQQCVSDLPVVLRYKGRDFVLDGHHRLASKIIRGQHKAKVYFWDLDAMLVAA